MNASSITAELQQELQQLEQYVVYDTIVRQLGGEISRQFELMFEMLTSICSVSATMLYIWDFGAQRLIFNNAIN
jgi:hypothetical protein